MKQTILLLLIFTLTYSSVYSQDKISEWINGARTRYKTDGTGKSLGLKLSIDYPKAWTEEDGKRPHILRKFTGIGDQPKNAMFLVQVTSLKPDEQEEILAGISNPYNFKQSLPSEAIFISGDKCKIDGLNGAYYTYKMSRSNDLITVYMKTKSYNFVYKDKWIIIGFTASASSESDADNFFSKINPLFVLIANSFVLYNQWER